MVTRANFPSTVVNRIESTGVPPSGGAPDFNSYIWNRPLSSTFTNVAVSENVAPHGMPSNPLGSLVMGTAPAGDSRRNDASPTRKRNRGPGVRARGVWWRVVRARGQGGGIGNMFITLPRVCGYYSK